MNQVKIHINEAHEITFGKHSIRRMIETAEPGDYMLSLEEWKSAKTNRQNAFFHGPVVKVYSDYTGYTRDEAKYMLKVKFGFNKIIKDKDTGKQIVQVRSIAEYTKDQMMEFLDRVLHHLEYDCNMIIDAETRKQFQLDELTGELTELA